MSKNEQIEALINAYIELARRDGYEDFAIIDALADIFDQKELEELGFSDFVKAYYDSSENEWLAAIATAKVANFFGIDPENPDDAEENPGVWQLCSDLMGASFDELTNKGNDYYVIDKLVSEFLQKRNTSDPEDDIWRMVILEHIQSVSKG